MNCHGIPALALALSLLTSPTAQAAESRPASSGQTLDTRISIDLMDASAGETFAALAKMTGSQIETEPAVVAKKVTVRLQNVRVSTALDTLCDSIGCRWSFSPLAGEDAVLRVSQLGASEASKAPASLEALLDDRISVQLREAAFEEVMRSFALPLGAKLELDPKLAGGEVNLSLSNARIRDALDAIVGNAPYHWRLAESNGERVLKVWKE